MGGLASDVSWLKKGFYGLAVVLASAIIFALLNIWQPLKDLEKAAAVQGETLNVIKEDVRDIGQKLDRQFDGVGAQTLNQKPTPIAPN